MVPAVQQGDGMGGEHFIAKTDSSTQKANTPESPTMSTHSPHVPSPASTESLLERTLDELLMSPMGDIAASPLMPDQSTPHTSANHIDLTSMVATFSKMLSCRLAQTATQITSDIQADLQNHG